MNATVEFRVIACPSCAMPFAITTAYENRRRQDHAAFQCPSGHWQSFPTETEEERLRSLVKARGDQIVSLQNERTDLRRRLSRKRTKSI